MLRPGKEATPAAAVRVRVPASDPLLGLVPIATVILATNPEATLSCASNAVTCTAGVSAVPAVASLGCEVNTSLVAAPAGAMLNALLVPPVRPPADAASV